MINNHSMGCRKDLDFNGSIHTLTEFGREQNLLVRGDSSAPKDENKEKKYSICSIMLQSGSMRDNSI